MNDRLNTSKTGANARNSVEAVYLFMTNAFDRLSHRKLINKVTDLMFSWFMSGATSEWFHLRSRPATSGSIQGSAIGPLPFFCT